MDQQKTETEIKTEERIRQIKIEIRDILFELTAWTCRFNPIQSPAALKRLGINNPKLYNSLKNYYKLVAEDNLLKDEPREFKDFEEMLVEVLDKEAKVL